MSHNQRFGRFGEDMAAEHYSRSGAEILARNWRGRQGEIDLIVLDRSGLRPVLVFAEVKARTTKVYGSGFDAVDWRKRKRLRSLAGIWLADAKPEGLGFDRMRFDVVDVNADGAVRVIENGF